ncbi:hypothetical protein Adeh_3986 [Anaeromyxobacter dehalogenans 2CP-C]|uniref:Uncharacterized protein n=1 Tax=Anaeromyxobacter dehalogenans (strain 2CP-C) TaxID=290397 RepID=Q2IGN9_ANADE|nr:hypothetical protein Adeh_3986 [Anaeromyxobacter dehalogenans 2CP-C]
MLAGRGGAGSACERPVRELGLAFVGRGRVVSRRIPLMVSRQKSPRAEPPNSAHGEPRRTMSGVALMVSDGLRPNGNARRP